jgi:hypothetical protein
VPRAALQELLFPKAGERSGAHSLRQLLYKLRQLGAPIHAEGDVVWVSPSDVVGSTDAVSVTEEAPHMRDLTRLSAPLRPSRLQSRPEAVTPPAVEAAGGITNVLHEHRWLRSHHRFSGSQMKAVPQSTYTDKSLDVAATPRASVTVTPIEWLTCGS